MPQLNVPASIITPPIEVPCPPIHFVADSITTFAPCFIGWQIAPPAPKVLSTKSGKSYFFAKAAKASKSGTLSPGFPMVSRYNNFVFSSTYTKPKPSCHW